MRDVLSPPGLTCSGMKSFPSCFRKEDDYAILYGKTGRPNFSVARLLGLCLLQEWNDLSDQEALDTFSFDVRWRYALDVSDEEDYLSRRSLVEFRRRLAAKDPEMKLIRIVVRQHQGFSNRQARSLHKQPAPRFHPHRLQHTPPGQSGPFHEHHESLPQEPRQRTTSLGCLPAIREWHEKEPEGWFGLGPAEQKAKLEELARYLHELIVSSRRTISESPTNC